MRITLILAASYGLAAASFAQSLPSFEVATVKPTDPKGRIIGFFTYPGGRIRAAHWSVFALIIDAFEIKPFQIAGGPRWITDEGFDIEAKPPASSESSKASPSSPDAPPNEEQRRMLQSLLADRFQLRFHWETKEGTVYLLQRGKGELKLREPKDPNAYHWAGGNRPGTFTGDGLAGINISMSELADRLSVWLGSPVQDRTGLNGSYDFKYACPPEECSPDRNFELTDSLRALGLRLEASRGPISTLVIDHVERPSPD